MCKEGFVIPLHMNRNGGAGIGATHPTCFGFEISVPFSVCSDLSTLNCKDRRGPTETLVEHLWQKHIL